MIDDVIPPSDLTAEGAVLSVIFISPGELDKVSAILAPEDFYSGAHGEIYRAAMEVHAAGEVPDAVTVGAKLKTAGKLGAIGGMAYLTQLLEVAPSLTNVEAYARIVKDKAILRNLAVTCRDITSKCYGQVENVSEFLAAAEKRVQTVAQEETKTQAAEVTGSILKRVVKNIMSGKRNGLETGITRWDRVTGGLHDGETTLIGARPGRGKTALALHVSYHVADEVNVVAYFSLEMTKDVLVTRAMCAEARVDVLAALNGTLTESQFKKFCDAGYKVGFKRVMVDDDPSITIVDIFNRARSIKASAERAGRKLRLIVVDHVGLVKPTKEASKKGSREQEVAEVSKGMARMAKRLNVPVLGLVQLNRESAKRGVSDTIPRLSDIRESGSLEQDARQVVFIHREENHGRPSPASAIGDGMNAGGAVGDASAAQLVIAKQNNGPTGIVTVGWEGYCTRFYNIGE